MTAPPLPEATEARALDAHAHRLLDVAAGARHPDGGYAWVRDDGTPDPARPHELWITCRMTHVDAHVDAHGGWHPRVGPD